MDVYMVLLLGFLLMCVLIALLMKRRAVAWWKSILLSLSMALIGLGGSEFWFWIENGQFGGRSVYGAIFMAPLLIYPVAKALHLAYSDAMDFIVPAGCLTLVLIKYQCVQDGCCQGRILYTDQDGIFVRFPSQYVEALIFALLLIVLYVMAWKKIAAGKIYPWFLILYGASRFLLNILRDEWTTFEGFLPYGNIWSLVAIAIGFVWIWVLNHRNAREKI